MIKKLVPAYKTPERKRLEGNVEQLRIDRKYEKELLRLQNRNPRLDEMADVRERKRNNRKNNFSKYGLTTDKYNELLFLQNNRCAICNKRFGKKKVPNIDHDHKTRQVRGLLCANCNWLLGHAKDKIFILEKAIKYLENK
jgi:hypothetical protein